MREYVTHNGVRYYRSKSHRYLQANGGELLHRRICEDAHGPIPPGYDVHHIDHDPENKDPSNLVAIPREEHGRIHMAERREHLEKMWGAGQKAWVEYEGRVEICSDCGVEFHHRRRVDLGRCPDCNEKRRVEKYRADDTFFVDAACVICGESFRAGRYYRDGKISDDHVKTCSRSCTAKLAYRNRAEPQDYTSVSEGVKKAWAERPDKHGTCVDCGDGFSYRSQRVVERCGGCQRNRARERQNERRRQRRASGD